LGHRGCGYMEHRLQQKFLRGGPDDAGVILILSLVCQMLADAAVLPSPLIWLVRIGMSISAILISAGVFSSILSPTATQPNGTMSLIYIGAVILAITVLTLAVGLLRVTRPA